MQTANVKIEGGPVGLDSIMVNDQDITKQVTALTVVANGPRELTEVHITSPTELALDLDGVVYVRDEFDSASVMSSLEEWIRTRDASQIEELALKSFGMDDDETMTQKVLGILADMAGEASESAE